MSVEQDVGMLQGQMEALQKSCSALEDDVNSLRLSVKELNLMVTNLNLTLQTTLAEGKGGWKVIGILSSVALTAGAGIGWILNHFHTN